MTVSLLIRRRKQKQHSQPDLPRMLFPQLICLVNSYSSFKIQIRYHLQKAFQATFPPPTWFRCFPTLSYYSSRGFLSCTLSILSCNYFPATKGWGWGKEDHSKWPETTRISTSIEMHVPGPHPHLLNLHFNKPASQVIFMHFEKNCITVWAPRN